MCLAGSYINLTDTIYLKLGLVPTVSSAMEIAPVGVSLVCTNDFNWTGNQVTVILPKVLYVNIQITSAYSDWRSNLELCIV